MTDPQQFTKIRGMHGDTDNDQGGGFCTTEGLRWSLQPLFLYYPSSSQTQVNGRAHEGPHVHLGDADQVSGEGGGQLRLSVQEVPQGHRAGARSTAGNSRETRHYFLPQSQAFLVDGVHLPGEAGHLASWSSGIRSTMSDRMSSCSVLPVGSSTRPVLHRPPTRTCLTKARHSTYSVKSINFLSG